MSEYISYKDIINNIEINKDDIVLIASDIKKLYLSSYLNKENFDMDIFINTIQEKIGKEGTLLFPTYNWGFCKGEKFDHNTTPSKTGSLSQKALERDDFVRTKHPIYSFAVWGKYQDYLCNLENKASFGIGSPFDFLHKNNAKMLFIDISLQNSFTFVHHVEMINKVNYRYDKVFVSQYVDNNSNIAEKEYSMYVRDLEKNVQTALDPIEDKFEKLGLTKKYRINNIDYKLINLNEAYKVIEDDIKHNKAMLIHTEDFLE